MDVFLAAIAFYAALTFYSARGDSSLLLLPFKPVAAELVVPPELANSSGSTNFSITVWPGGDFIFFYNPKLFNTLPTDAISLTAISFRVTVLSAGTNLEIVMPSFRIFIGINKGPLIATNAIPSLDDWRAVYDGYSQRIFPATEKEFNLHCVLKAPYTYDRGKGNLAVWIVAVGEFARPGTFQLDAESTDYGMAIVRTGPEPSSSLITVGASFSCLPVPSSLPFAYFEAARVMTNTLQMDFSVLLGNTTADARLYSSQSPSGPYEAESQAAIQSTIPGVVRASVSLQEMFKFFRLVLE